jgi:hypothetical protein
MIKNKIIIPIVVALLIGVVIFPEFLEGSKNNLDDDMTSFLITGNFDLDIIDLDIIKKIWPFGGGKGDGRKDDTWNIPLKVVIPYSASDLGTEFNKRNYAEPLLKDFENKVMIPAQYHIGASLHPFNVNIRFNIPRKNKVYINLDKEGSYYHDHFFTYTIQEGRNANKTILCPKSLDDIRTFVEKIENKETNAISKDGAISVFLFDDIYCIDNPNSNLTGALAWAQPGYKGENMDTAGYLVFHMFENINSELEFEHGADERYYLPTGFAHEFLHIYGLGHYRGINFGGRLNIMRPGLLKVREKSRGDLFPEQSGMFLSRKYIDKDPVRFYNGEPGFFSELLGNPDVQCGNGWLDAWYYPSHPNVPMIEGCEKNFYVKVDDEHFCIKLSDERGIYLDHPEMPTGALTDTRCNINWTVQWEGCRCYVPGCEPKPPPKGNNSGDDPPNLCEGNCWAEGEDCVSVNKLSEFHWPGLDCTCAPPCEEATKDKNCFGYCDVGNKCGPNPDPEVQDDSCYCRDCVIYSGNGYKKPLDYCDSMGDYGCGTDIMGKEYVCERGMTTLYSDPMCMCMLKENEGSDKNRGKRGRNDCGDGFANATLGEECDPPGSDVVCECDGYGACSGTQFLGVCSKDCEDDCSASPGANPYQSYCRTNADCLNSMECILYNNPTDPCLVGCGFCNIKAQHVSGATVYGGNSNYQVHP